MNSPMQTVVLYAVLLGGTMTASYLTWTAEEDTRTEDDRAVEVYRASAGDVTKVAFDSEKLKVTVERREDALGAYPWVIIDETKETKVAPSHDHDGDHDDEGETEGDTDVTGPDVAPEEPPEPEVQVEQVHLEFRGNDNADGLLTAYEPLMAMRELDPSSGKAEVFGFDEPSGTITVSRKTGGDVSLTLGGETYGSRDRYAKTDGRLLLLASTTIKPLQFAASRTIERRLHPFAEQDVDQVALVLPSGELSLTQKNKDDRKAAFWTRDGSEPDDEAGSWLQKLFRLRADQYATEEEVEGMGSVLTATLTTSEGAHRIELLRGAEDGDVYARSDFLRGIAQIKKADALELLADAEDVFQ